MPDHNEQTRPASSSSASKPAKLEAMKWAERLMIRFQTLYRDSFAKHIDTDEKIADWLEVWSMVLGTMTGEQVKTALDKTTMAHKWPPTPAEFKALCIPDVDYQATFADAANGRWTIAAVYWAAQRFGRFELRTATWQKAGERWIKLLDDALADPDLPEIPEHKALPAPAASYSQEAGRAALQSIKGMLKPKEPGTQWAQDILDAIANGEPQHYVAVQMACRALGKDIHDIQFATPVQPKPIPQPELPDHHLCYQIDSNGQRCQYAGTRSHGGEKWYCREHYRA